MTVGILRECWTNVHGKYHATFLVGDPRFPDHPSSQEILPIFEARTEQRDNYGARFSGLLQPPESGKYTFWLSAFEGAELYLSADDDPAHKRQIAYAAQTPSHDWAHHPGQKSSAITLSAGRKYYIEALHKHSKGADHLEVAWEGPDRPREIIPGEFLLSFEKKARNR